MESLRDDSKSGRSERRRMKDQKKKRNDEPRTWTNIFHLIGSLVMLVLCITHAILLAEYRKDRLELKADPDVASILFGSLIWLVMLLSFLESTAGANYTQYVPWMISLLSYTVSSAFSTAKYAKAGVDIFVQWLRLGLVLILVASVIVSRKRRIKLEDGKSNEEAQALLVSNEPEIQTEDENGKTDELNDDDDKSVVTTFSDDEEEEGAELTDVQKEEKKQRVALRDRPWYQYIASFKIFVPFVRPKTTWQWFYLSVMILNTVAARGIALGQPLMLGAVIDDLAQRKFVVWKILAYVGLRFASSSSGISLIKNLVSYRLNIELHNALLNHCYNHIMDLDASFHLSKSTPETWQIMDRGSSVINLLQDVVFDHLPVIADLIIALGVVSHLFGAYLCFAVATTMILLSWSNRITMSKKTRMRRYFVDLWRNWYTHMNESFMHWRTVSEFNKIAFEKDRHHTKTRAYTRVSIQQRSFGNYLAAIQEIVVTTGFLFVCLIAALEISAGRLDVSRFVVLITYWGTIMSPVTRIASFASDIAEQLVDAEKLMLLLERKPRVTSKPNAPLFKFKGGRVEFKNCSFSYDNNRVVTKNVSFTAEKGQTIAIVGETGGGKSTIFNLFYRFYDPSEGQILVDGQDISQVNLESYRAVLGLVPQDPVLFNSSILKNIRYSNTESSPMEVVEASKAAQFHEKVEKFPKKYLQKVGELAQKLSGGERQRLAIARAIIKKPGILLLDEATSAVDSVTEARIQESLDQLSEGRTTFVIAHRLSTILNADKILVIKGGEVLESGSHQELLDHGNGAYRELWEAQLKLSAGKAKKEKKPDLMSFDESSDGETNKDGDSPAKDSQYDSGDEGKDVKVGHAEAISGGLLTPPATRDPTPRTGSVHNMETKTEATAEEDTVVQNDTPKDASETSSVKSEQSRKSKSYGTMS